MYTNTGLTFRRLTGTAILLTGLIAGMFAGLSLTAQAAGHETDFCATLDDDTCQLLTDSQAVMESLTSVSNELTVQVEVSNIPEVPFEAIAFELYQTSSYVMTEDAMAAQDELDSLLHSDNASVEDVFALSMNMALGMNADSEMYLAVSDDVITLIEMAAEEEGEPLPFELPNEFGLGVRIVDGAVYYNLGALGDLVPGVRILGDLWFGVEFGDSMDMLIEAIMEDPDFDDIDPNLLGMMMGNASMGGIASGPMVAALAQSPITAAAIPFLIVERLEDDEIEGRATAVVRTTVDYAMLLADPTIQDLLAGLMAEEGMSDAEVEEILGIAQLFGPTVLETLGLEAYEYVDIETGLHLGGEMVLNWDVSELGPLLAMAGAGDALEGEELPVVAMYASMGYGNYDAEMNITEPETGIVFSFEELMMLAEMAE